MSEIYIKYPKKWIYLWALICTKGITHVFAHKTRFTLNFWQISAFFIPQSEQNTVPQIWNTISLTFSQKKRGW